MASEYQYAIVSGLTLYARMLNSAAQVWNGSSFVATSGSFSSSIKTALTDDGEGRYNGNAPSGSVAAGGVQAEYRIQAGGSPATTDAILDNSPIAILGTDAADSPNAVTAQGTAAQLQYGIQSNGIGGYQATTNWLALSPSSGGGDTNNYYISVPGGITGSANAPFDNFQLLLKQNYTFTQTFTYAPGYSIGAYTQIAFMLKQAAGTDQSSVAWVIVSNPPQADDGLYWFNGAPPTSPLSKSDASIVVSAAGIIVTMSPTLTSLLSPQAVYSGEIAQYTSTGKIPLGTGTVSVNAPVIDQLTPVS